MLGSTQEIGAIMYNTRIETKKPWFIRAYFISSAYKIKIWWFCTPESVKEFVFVSAVYQFCVCVCVTSFCVIVFVMP